MNEQGPRTSVTSPSNGDRIEDLVDRAFHFRGDVTLHLSNGVSLVGYLFNRNDRAAEPFAQLFETQTGREISIPYVNISGVLFTGRDAAEVSAKHYEAFQERTGTSAPQERDSPLV